LFYLMCCWFIFCWCILLHTRSCVSAFIPHISMFCMS
jgi:hypothetical protein